MITAAERDAMLARLIAAGGPWDPAAVFLGVAEAIADNGYQTVIGDITAPTGDSGTRQAVTTWAGPFIDVNGAAYVDSPARVFANSGGDDPTVLVGWYTATLVTLGVLRHFGLFANPVSLPDEFAQATIILRLRVDPAGSFDLSFVVNG